MQKNQNITIQYKIMLTNSDQTNILQHTSIHKSQNIIFNNKKLYQLL